MRSFEMYAMVGILVLGGLASSRVNAQPPPKVCLVTVSKDLCVVQVRPMGAPDHLFKCTSPPCETLEIPKSLTGKLQANAACDATPDLNGATFSTANYYNFQLPALRGFWGSTFHLSAPTATGTLNATLGVGTHRKACDGRCDAKCEGNCAGATCEPCYDVVYDAGAKAWKIHTEGTMEGAITSGPHANCKIHWSFQGAFTAPGAGPPAPPQSNFTSFCGTIDGVLECPCT